MLSPHYEIYFEGFLPLPSLPEKERVKEGGLDRVKGGVGQDRVRGGDKIEGKVGV